MQEYAPAALRIEAKRMTDRYPPNPINNQIKILLQSQDLLAAYIFVRLLFPDHPYIDNPIQFLQDRLEDLSVLQIPSTTRHTLNQTTLLQASLSAASYYLNASTTDDHNINSLMVESRPTIHETTTNQFLDTSHLQLSTQSIANRIQYNMLQNGHEANVQWDGHTARLNDEQIYFFTNRRRAIFPHPLNSQGYLYVSNRPRLHIAESIDPNQPPRARISTLGCKINAALTDTSQPQRSQTIATYAQTTRNSVFAQLIDTVHRTNEGTNQSHGTEFFADRQIHEAELQFHHQARHPNPTSDYSTRETYRLTQWESEIAREYSGVDGTKKTKLYITPNQAIWEREINGDHVAVEFRNNQIHLSLNRQPIDLKFDPQHTDSPLALWMQENLEINHLTNMCLLKVKDANESILLADTPPLLQVVRYQPPQTLYSFNDFNHFPGITNCPDKQIAYLLEVLNQQLVERNNTNSPIGTDFLNPHSITSSNTNQDTNASTQTSTEVTLSNTS